MSIQHLAFVVKEIEAAHRSYTEAMSCVLAKISLRQAKRANGG